MPGLSVYARFPKNVRPLLAGTVAHAKIGVAGNARFIQGYSAFLSGKKTTDGIMPPDRLPDAEAIAGALSTEGYTGSRFARISTSGYGAVIYDATIRIHESKQVCIIFDVPGVGRAIMGDGFVIMSDLKSPSEFTTAFARFGLSEPFSDEARKKLNIDKLYLDLFTLENFQKGIKEAKGNSFFLVLEKV